VFRAMFLLSLYTVCVCHAVLNHTFTFTFTLFLCRRGVQNSFCLSGFCVDF